MSSPDDEGDSDEGTPTPSDTASPEESLSPENGDDDADGTPDPNPSDTASPEVSLSDEEDDFTITTIPKEEETTWYNDEEMGDY